jgi:hypothetical protein
VRRSQAAACAGRRPQTDLPGGDAVTQARAERSEASRTKTSREGTTSTVHVLSHPTRHDTTPHHTTHDTPTVVVAAGCYLAGWLAVQTVAAPHAQPPRACGRLCVAQA